MDAGIFKKMKVRPGASAKVIGAPDDYPHATELVWDAEGPFDFVHLFLESKAGFEACFAEASEACAVGGLLWVSYRKAQGKVKYDINRDSLWGLLLDKGFHPVSQVALDEGWSAVRVKRNVPGKTYEIPGNVKK